MTGSDDSHSSTRPISVAELLAKNGSIGAPPVGGKRKRRRRRGNTDAVTVAELTGEIPIIGPDDPDPSAPAAAVEEQVEEADTDAVQSVNGVVDHIDAEAETVVPELADEGPGDAVDGVVESPEDAVDEVVEGPGDAVDEVVEGPGDAVDGVVEGPGDAVDEVVEGPEDTVHEDAEVAEELEVSTVPEQDTDNLGVPEQDGDTDSHEVIAHASAGDDVDDDYADAVAEFAARVEHRGDPDPADPEPPPRRFGFGRKSAKKAKKSKKAEKETEVAESAEVTDSAEKPEESNDKPEDSAAADAEQMNPDPPEDGDETDRLGAPADLLLAPDIGDLDDDAATFADDGEELPSYLRSTQEPLFGGQTVADDLARRGVRPAQADADLGDVGGLGGLEDLEQEPDGEYGEPRRMSAFVYGLWIVGQSIFAVLFGAGLFVAFDQLWRWNNIVALVLSVLVILGLVVAVRVVRKTEDIGSTLIALAVGALVTLGPLALLQSG